jgi:hypothetical protein
MCAQQGPVEQGAHPFTIGFFGGVDLCLRNVQLITIRPRLLLNPRDRKGC